MKISVDFNSIEEMQDFCKKFATPDEVHEQKLVAVIEEKEKPKEEAPDPEPEEVEEEEEKVDIAELTVTARKALAKVNKKTGENTAKTWIKEKGYDSLADIKDPDVLKELTKKAEEFLDA